MSKVAEVQRLARAAAKQAIEETYALQGFSIVKFGRHRDGYLHAQVSIAGQGTVYVHRRWGSWLLPMPNDNPLSPVFREVVAPYNDALAERAREFTRAERQRELALERATKRKEESHGTSSTATDAGGVDSPGTAFGVPG